MAFSLKQLLIFCLSIFSAIQIPAQTIIPQPVRLQQTSGAFLIGPGTKIYYQEGLQAQAELLGSALSPATGVDIPLLKYHPGIKSGIILKLDRSISETQEAYHLSIKNNIVNLSGSTAAGVFYAGQSLLQLMPPAIFDHTRQRNTVWRINNADISDSPQYAWRGMMLDVSRYFFSKDYVLKFINMMAMHKLNVLHFHLVDDAGWRLEIKKYPKLTSIGAWRGEGAERKGGYYTQDDIREMVAYAAARNVTIVPEIELPAHTLSAIAAYPFLCCTEEQYTVQTQHSISKELYCSGKESTFDFLADVFKETFALFPSKYIHIGGDEANYERWKACPHCQKRKAELGLKTEKELQVYFNQRVQQMVAMYGKTIVGWDEIIEEGLKQKAVGMIWHDPAKTWKAVEKGHDVIMTLTSHLYFDVAESKIPGEIKSATWLSPISLEKVYSLNPMIEGLDSKYRPQVLGASAALWADQFIHSTTLQELPQLNENRSEMYFDYLALPRMAALAEICWTPADQQNWTTFEKKMSSQYRRYDHAGYGYRVPEPKLLSNEKTGTGNRLELKSPIDGAEVRYSLDGTRANAYSALYTKPLQVEQLSGFSAITVVNRNHYSLPLYFPEKYEKFKPYGTLTAEWAPGKIKAGNFTEIEINVSGKVNSNGIYELAFWYTSGNSRLDISGITVFKNGVQISTDQHNGFTGGEHQDNIYRFEVKEYETGTAFILKAMVRGDISNDSYGAVFIKKL